MVEAGNAKNCIAQSRIGFLSAISSGRPPLTITPKISCRIPWARERGAALQIPTMVRELVSRYQVVFFLLGREYLNSLGIPPVPRVGQKFIYFGTAVERFHLPSAGVVMLPAAQTEARRYGGTGVTGIKGRMFDLFARGITAHPEHWDSFLEDRTAKTLLDVLNKAK